MDTGGHIDRFLFFSGKAATTTTTTEENRNSVQGAAVATGVASVTESEEISGPTLRPEGGFNPRVVFEVRNSRNALSEAGSDHLCFPHLHTVHHQDPTWPKTLRRRYRSLLEERGR